MKCVLSEGVINKLEEAVQLWCDEGNLDGKPAILAYAMLINIKLCFLKQIENIKYNFPVK